MKESIKESVRKVIFSDEVRVSVGTNEYRTILVAVDTSNFMEAKKVVFLNSFLKKSTKQYKAEIKKAFEIIENMED